MPQDPVSSQAVQQAILQALYALFLGGIITAFLVVGLNTFYPSPTEDQDRATAIAQRESEIYECPQSDVACAPTAAEEAELRQLQLQREELWQEHEAAQADWSRTAGVVLVGFATGLLALSLIRWDAAIVLSNGLLLGGLFTMVGGIGLTIAGGEGIARFLVLTLALAITVGLGYLRFARRVEAVAAPARRDSGEAAGADDELGARVAELEARLSEVRRALGG